MADREAREANPKMMQSAGEHREVIKKEAAEKYLGTMKKQHRGQQPAVGRRREPKDLTRGDWHGARETSSGNSDLGKLRTPE
jgi:hypothetical protein